MWIMSGMSESEPLTIATVLWQGSFRNRAYTPEWVHRMKRRVAKTAPTHKFVCLSNVAIPGVDVIPLVSDHEGWWAKTELFRPDNGLEGNVLYLDLDTLPIKNLDVFCKFDVSLKFAPSSYTFTNSRPAGGKGVVDGYQSSLIAFKAGEFPHLFTEVDATVKSRFRGDQDWFAFREPTCPTFPSGWFKKLKDCQEGPASSTHLVLCMPWKNDIAIEKFEWVRNLWV